MLRDILPSADPKATLDREPANDIQMSIHSDEGDLFHETRLRDHLAFLLNELDASQRIRAIPSAA